MKQFEVTLSVTPPQGFRQEPYTLVYEVEAWDTEHAIDRAMAYAVRSRGVWREWTEARVLPVPKSVRAREY
jgi:hypothetical protein